MASNTVTRREHPDLRPSLASRLATTPSRARPGRSHGNPNHAASGLFLEILADAGYQGTGAQTGERVTAPSQVLEGRSRRVRGTARAATQGPLLTAHPRRARHPAPENGGCSLTTLGDASTCATSSTSSPSALTLANRHPRPRPLNVNPDDAAHLDVPRLSMHEVVRAVPQMVGGVRHQMPTCAFMQAPTTPSSSATHCAPAEEACSIWPRPVRRDEADAPQRHDLVPFRQRGRRLRPRGGVPLLTQAAQANVSASRAARSFLSADQASTCNRWASTCRSSSLRAGQHSHRVRGHA
ncbi:hypothetical protein SAMN05216482_0121 [Streptomyces sp. PAN_FS17]|nr:hypothetical protein SAMN05216482_0121 [Streptomyces sp. PAN_FS17]